MQHITIQLALVLRILTAPYLLIQAFRNAIVNNAAFNPPNTGNVPDLIVAFMHVLNVIWFPLARKIVFTLDDRETFRAAVSNQYELAEELMAPLADEIYDAVWLQVDEQIRVESTSTGSAEEQEQQLESNLLPATIEDATVNVEYMKRDNGKPLFTALNGYVPQLIDNMMANVIQRERDN